MKLETLKLFKDLIDSGKIKFEFNPVKGVDVEYVLEDEELDNLIKSEYGDTMQDKDDLLKVMLKKLLTMAVDHAKDSNTSSTDT